MLRALSRKPASLEARLEVSPLGATEGSSMGPNWNHFLLLFSAPPKVMILAVYAVFFLIFGNF